MLLAAILGVVSGCAPSTRKVDVTWERVDGAPADQKDVLAARDQCISEIEQRRSRLGTLDWASQMLGCMKAKGFTRTEKERE